VQASSLFSPGFPTTSRALETFGLKFSPGGAHISRTMMLAELAAVLAAVPVGSGAADYREAILQRNVLAKDTDSTRQKSLRHLRELYVLSEDTPIFGLLRKLHAIDAAGLPLLAVQVAWARDPLFRATTPPIMAATQGQRVATASLADALETALPNQYSEPSRNRVARNAASSWTQSGHLAGHANKTRQRIEPTAAAVTMAFFLGSIAGYHGVAVFSNPWCANFEAADKGQMELYLSWLKRYECEPDEAEPLGMILCAGKSDEHVELMDLQRSGIHLATYLTELLPKEQLEQKLHEAVRLARLRLQTMHAGTIEDPLP